MTVPDDFNDLNSLLEDDEAKPQPAQPKARKRPAPPEETSETLETSAPVEDPTTQALLEQAMRTIAEQQEQINAMKQPQQVSENIYRAASDVPVAAVMTRNPNHISPTDLNPPPPENAVQIHFLEDGFTLGAQMYYRGGEAMVSPELAEMSPVDQQLTYGRVMFAKGPWPGLGLEAALDDPNLSADDRQKLAEIVAKQQGGFAAVQQRLFAAQRR